MGIADALSEIPAAKQNTRCGIAKLRDELDGKDLAAFNQALEMVYSQPRSVRQGRQHGATATWLAETLTSNGYRMTDGMIQRHIRGECSCGTL